MLVSRSEDGGASWVDVFNVGTGGLWGVDFVDRDHGWVVGGSSIYRTTTSRPENWESQSENVLGNPVDLYDVAFTDELRGVAVGRSKDAAGGAVVVITSDGGSHWARAGLAGLNEGPTGTWLTRLCIGPDGSGTAVGNGFFRDARPLVVTTGDSGATWVDRTAAVEAAASGRPTIANCARPTSLLQWLCGAPSFVARSDDDGASWRRQAVTKRRDVLFNAMLFADAQRGWVSGFDLAARQILVFGTDDGGATWREQVLVDDVVVLETQPVAALAMLGPRAIVLVGDDPNSFALEGSRALSFLSVDGGTTWSRSTIPGGFVAFWDVDVVP